MTQANPIPVQYYNFARKQWDTKLTTQPLSLIFEVQPEWAEVILAKHNPHNRRIEEERAKAHARAILDGRWNINNDDISFDYNGGLLNGQHRLRGVILAQRPVMMSFKFGLDPKSVLSMDEGRSRSAMDTSKIMGYGYTKSGIATANFLLRQIRAGQGGARGTQMARQEIYAFCDKHNEAIRFATTLASKLYAKAPIHAAIVRAWYEYSKPEERDRLSLFTLIVGTGQYTSDDDLAAVAFRSKVADRAIFRGKSRYDGGVVFSPAETLYRKTESAIRLFMQKVQDPRFYANIDRWKLPEEQ